MRLHVFNCTTCSLSVFTHVAVTTSLLLLSCLALLRWRFHVFGVCDKSSSTFQISKQVILQLELRSPPGRGVGGGKVDPRVAIHHILLSTLGL